MALTLVTSDLIGGLDYSKLTGTVPTWNQNTTGSAATLTTARNIGGVSFNGSVAINLPGVNTAGNQNTSGTAAGLSATLAVGSGGTGVTSITALKNVLDDQTWTFANATIFSSFVTTGGAIANPFKITANPGTRSLKLTSASTDRGTWISWLRGNETYEKAYLGFTSTSDDVFEVNNRENADMTFHTNTNERVRILAGGNVGIGNTNASDYSADANNLVVGSLSGNNGITILSTPSSGFGSLYFADGTTVNKVNSGYIRYKQNQSIMSFGVNAVEALNISLGGAATFSGSIALGGATIANSYLLEITAASGNIMRSTRGSSQFSMYQANNGGVFLGTTGNNDLRIIQNDGDALIIDTNKKVGIGTTSPGGKLHIVSSGGTDGLRLNAGTSASNYAIIANNQADNATLFYVKGDGAAHFSGNTSANVVTARDNMFVGAGQFYIGAENGSTNDTYRQEVGSGIFKIKSRKSGTWADKLHITSGGVLQIFGTSTANALSIAHDSGNNVTMSTPFLNTSQDLKIINSSAGVLLDYAATSWTSNSDENIKENIISLNHVLDKIKDIRCVNYNLKDETIYKKRLGFIAQDFQEDFAEVVNENSEGILGLRYTETIPILMKAIQEQQAQIELLKKEVELLKQ